MSDGIKNLESNPSDFRLYNSSAENEETGFQIVLKTFIKLDHKLDTKSILKQMVMTVMTMLLAYNAIRVEINN